mgnify:CR=1 FL=1
MTMLELVKHLNFAVVVLFTLLYLYQGFYVVVGLVRRRWQDRHQPSRLHRFAVIVSARNEEGVIGELLESLNRQNYPKELLDLYVVADNCTDDTAGAARRAGAFVYERFDQVHKGKGYAMDYLFRRLKEEGKDCYDGYFVFDADNLVDANFVAEMNRTFDQGYDAVTCYRNSKNFGSNWISAGYGVWFLREAKFLNQARLTLNTSCAVSGTGFFIAADILKAAGGWKWHLLTEDIEFSAASIIDGVRISYCPTAVLYDEQPITFRDSWNQRFRWAKGFYQVFAHYAGGLVKGTLTNPAGYRFACYDMLMTIAPGMLLSIISILFNTIIIVLAATGVMSTGVAIASSVTSVVFCLCNYVVFMFVFGVLTTFVEWDSIRTTTAKKIRYMFTFPFFMLTYIPIALIALVKKAAWKPIRHSISVDVAEFSEAEGVRLSSK